MRLINGVDQVEGLILLSQVGKGLVDEAYQANNQMEMMEEDLIGCVESADSGELLFK